MQLPIYQIDAFASGVFAGNPAAVCPLDEWLPDATMQSIALENNLSETAFFVREDDGYRIRWFTPTVEVDLCGHATLASAYLFLTRLQPGADDVRFQSRSGELRVTRDGDMLTLDFPAQPPVPVERPDGLDTALSAIPADVLKAGTRYFAVYDNAARIKALTPDFSAVAQLGSGSVIVTAPGETHDFVSRFFAPGHGIPEDPVTGSAHTALTPYWAARLGKTTLSAAQLSARGGELTCTMAGDRVKIAGHAVLYMEGTIHL